MSQFEESLPPTKVSASISRDGIAVATNQMVMEAMQSQTLVLKIPSDSAEDVNYRLHVEGRLSAAAVDAGAGAIVFQHDGDLEFTNQFLSITITTNNAIYDAGQTVRIRAVLLTTALKPYEGIADLFFIDPDGYIIRKWQSQHLNVGVLIKEFELPDWPKVGFWTVRIVAEGQVEDLRIKVQTSHTKPGFFYHFFKSYIDLKVSKS